MPINVSQNEIYESFSMLHPDGSLMCHCNEKKANWYIERSLAKWVSEKVFQLNFIPAGHGKSDNPYYTQAMENRCVVCGSTENLNKHHVVPYVFRSRLPVALKESNHHDILPTCVDCHEAYEGFATDYKTQLAAQVGYVIHTSSMTEEQRNNRKIISARALINRYDSGLLRNDRGEIVNIPVDRLKAIRAKAQEQLTQEVPLNGAVWADVIMKKVLQDDSLFDFVKAWREHFLEYAKPKYLPNHWSVNQPLEVSNRAKVRQK